MINHQMTIDENFPVSVRALKEQSIQGEVCDKRRLHAVRLVLSGILAVAALTISALIVTPIALGSTAITVLPAPSGSGAYVGAAQTSLMASFSEWRGRPTDFATDYLATDDWSKIEYPTWWLQRWSTTSTPLVLGVPMLVNDPATTLQRGATGEYDGHFRQLARTLVQYGYGNAALRVGWEMNGDWYRWSATTDPDGPRRMDCLLPQDCACDALCGWTVLPLRLERESGVERYACHAGLPGRRLRRLRRH
jgi:hypothetical protein